MIRLSQSFLNFTKLSGLNILKSASILNNPQQVNEGIITQQLNSSLNLSVKFSMASKKKEDKDEKKKKEKEKIKEQIGGDVTEIDLNKYEEPYKKVIDNFKVFLAKSRAGKLDATSFDDVEVRIGKEKLHVKHLAQIAPKNTLSVIVNPYDSDNLEAIEKAIKASDDTLEIVKIEKSLLVSLPNSSIQELKVKMVEKIKKSLHDHKEMLKKERHVCHEDLKKYEKIAQKDQLRQIEKEAKELYDKFNDMLDKLAKDKEKEIMK